MSAEPLTVLPPQGLAIRQAEASLAGLLDRAITGKQAILIFWGTVRLIQEEAFDSHAGNQIGEVLSHAENKPSPLGGRPSKPTDLKAIFERCGIAAGKMKTAYRFMAEGDAASEEFEAAVGRKVAKLITMQALVATPAGELPEPLRAKQMELFDFLAARDDAKAKAPAARGQGRLGAAGNNHTAAVSAAQQAQDLFHPITLALFKASSEGQKQKLLELPVTTSKPGDVTGLADLHTLAQTFTGLVWAALEEKKRTLRK